MRVVTSICTYSANFSNSLGILPTCNIVRSSLCSCSKPSDNICCCIYVQGIRPVLPRIFRSKVTQDHESLHKKSGPSLEEWRRDVWISKGKSNNNSIYSKHTCFCFVVPVLFFLHAGGEKIKSVIHLAPLTLMSLSNFTQWYRDLRLRYSHVCMMSSCRARYTELNPLHTLPKANVAPAIWPYHK